MSALWGLLRYHVTCLRRKFSMTHEEAEQVRCFAHASMCTLLISTSVSCILIARRGRIVA